MSKLYQAPIKRTRDHVRQIKIQIDLILASQGFYVHFVPYVRNVRKEQRGRSNLGLHVQYLLVCV